MWIIQKTKSPSSFWYISLWRIWILTPKFQFPENPPWTYPTPIFNLTISHAKKDQTDHFIFLSKGTLVLRGGGGVVGVGGGIVCYQIFKIPLKHGVFIK